MRKLNLLAAALILSGAMGQSVDWPMAGGSPQRAGFQKHEKILNTGNVGHMQLLWKRAFDTEINGRDQLTSPIILGRLITHHGFQELVFVAESYGKVYAIDADLNRVLWSRQLRLIPGINPLSPKYCSPELTAAPLFAPLPQNKLDDDEDNPLAPRPIYVVASGDQIYALQPMTGLDVAPPLQFLPWASEISNLNVSSTSLYTATTGACRNVPAGVWAIDPSRADVKPRLFQLPESIQVDQAEVAVGNDGTVYALFRYNASHTSEGGMPSGILSLTPEDLKLKGYYAPAITPPVILTWKQRELIATADADGSLVLLDAHTVGGADHQQALFRGKPLANGETISSLSAVEDADGTTWIYAATRKRNDNSGSITAFKLIAKNDEPEAVPVWTSRSFAAPAAPVTANGLVYALATGEYSGSAQSPAERASRSVPAVLYALDASTGKELYSSGSAVGSFTHSSSLAVANGHVCFTTWDNTLYCFGLPVDL